MSYMEDYEDYIELDTISYSIYEEVVKEKDAEIEKMQEENYQLQLRIEELEDLNAKKFNFQNQRKIRI